MSRGRSDDSCSVGYGACHYAPPRAQAGLADPMVSIVACKNKRLAAIGSPASGLALAWRLRPHVGEGRDTPFCTVLECTGVFTSYMMLPVYHRGHVHHGIRAGLADDSTVGPTPASSIVLLKLVRSRVRTVHPTVILDLDHLYPCLKCDPKNLSSATCRQLNAMAVYNSRLESENSQNTTGLQEETHVHIVRPLAVLKIEESLGTKVETLTSECT